MSSALHVEPLPTSEVWRLFQAVPAICVAVAADDAFTILAGTDLFFATIGRGRDELVGRSFFDAFPHDASAPATTAAIPRLHRSFEQVIRTRAPHAMDVERYDLPRADGSVETRYWAIDNKPVLGADGAVAYVLHRSEDVTELVRLREADARLSAVNQHVRERVLDMEASGSTPAASPERDVAAVTAEGGPRALHSVVALWNRETRLLHRALSAMEDHAFVLDEHLRFIYVNEALLALWGRAPAEALGRSFADVGYAAAARLALESNVRRVFETGAPLRDEGTYTTHGGVEASIEYSLAPVRDAEGNVEAVAGWGRDVTEQRTRELERARAEAAHRSSDERFRTLFESIDEGFCVVEMLFDERGQPNDYRFLEMNPAFEKHTGLSNVLGRSVREMGLALEPHWFQTYGRVALTGEPVRFVNEAKDLSGRWFDVYAFRLHGPESRRIAILFKDITEQRRAEEGLRQNEARWRGIFEHLHEGFLIGEVVHDEAGRAVDWRYVQMNAAWERLTGLGREDAIGRRITEVIPGVEPEWVANLAGVVASGEPATAEMYSAALGRWYETHSFRTEPGRFACIFLDVTERRRAEEAQRASDERLADVFQRAPSFMCILQGPDHVFERANDRYFQLVGGRDILGKPAREALPEIRGQGFFELLDRVYQTGRPWTGTDMAVSLVRTPGGAAEQRFVDFVYQPLRGPDGAVTGIFAQGVDLTERKRAEAALRESETRLRLIMSNVKDHAIFTLDLDGRVTSWNIGAERVFGYTADEMLGRPTDHLFTAEDRANDRPRVERELATNAGIADDTRSHMRKDGTRFFSSGSMEGLRDETDALRGYVKVVRDITERKRLEEQREGLLASERRAREQAERASRLKDDFLATLSHELRTPLNAILGWSQILARKAAEDPKTLRQGLGVIERNARAQAQLIDDLLDMSRIISGKVRLQAQDIALVDVIEPALASARPSAEAKEIILTSSVDASAGFMWGDPERLQQVFWNLLTNAIKFTPSGGRVSVSAERVGSRLEIRVTDTGRGIPSSFLPHVFDRFRQADASTTRVHGGLGIGLSIVKNLVELHGGTVSAASPGEQQGATFTVSLPVPTVDARHALGAPLGPAPDHHDSARNVEERLDGITVLVVDDEADARELVTTLLTGCGATVLSAGSVGEALVIVREARPDVLLSDIGMPHEDGYALIRQVRALPAEAGGRVPAAALTAFARSEDRQRALRAGYQIHVPKPIDPPELVTVVASLAASVATS